MCVPCSTFAAEGLYALVRFKAPMRRLSLRYGVCAALSLASSIAGAQSVRIYHPRIFLNAAGQRGVAPVTMRARCEAPTSLYARACRVAAPLPTPPTGFQPPRNAPLTIINSALRFLLYNEDTALAAVRDEVNRVGPFIDRGDESGQVLANATRVLHLAVAYDWLYVSLAPSERATIQSYLQSYAEYNITHEPRDVFSSEAVTQAAAIGLAGLALAEQSDTPMTPASRYIAYANARFKTFLLPAMGYLRGWWPEGPAWFHTYAGRYALYFAIAWTTSTGEDLFAWARQNVNDPFGAWVRYEAYALRPDMRFEPYGDALGEAPPGAAGNRPLLDMLAWATGTPIAQALANEITARLPTGTDYQGPEAWHQIVFYDPLRPSQPGRDDLPFAAHLSPTAADVVVMRGSWNDPEALYLTLSCGDYFTRRQHIEAGSFTLYRRVPLAVHTGTWDGYETNHWLNWYAQRSIHANTLAVLRPGETFAYARMIPSVNDGGQRAMTYTIRGRAALTEYRNNLTAGEHFDTGAITAFETTRYHDYAACDITRAYNSTAVTARGAVPKVREVTRQLVLLRPELVVLFDRVEATDPSFERRFMLHGLTRPVPGRDNTFSVTRANGRLLARTLLPAQPGTRAVDNYQVDGQNVMPLVTLDDHRGGRIEVTAPRGEARTYFLHVFDATNTEREQLPPMSLIEEPDRVGVRVADPSMERSYTLTFARTGPSAGDIRVQDTNGRVLYEGALGAGGAFYPVVGDGGVARGDGGVRDGGADGGMMPPETPEGCGCRTTMPRPDAWVWCAGLAVFVCSARRRRR
jgi:hypothetical protein